MRGGCQKSLLFAFAVLFAAAAVHFSISTGTTENQLAHACTRYLITSGYAWRLVVVVVVVAACKVHSDSFFLSSFPDSDSDSFCQWKLVKSWRALGSLSDSQFFLPFWLWFVCWSCCWAIIVPITDDCCCCCCGTSTWLHFFYQRAKKPHSFWHICDHFVWRRSRMRRKLWEWWR